VRKYLKQVLLDLDSTPQGIHYIDVNIAKSKIISKIKNALVPSTSAKEHSLESLLGVAKVNML
jgi:hypothetical protein